MNWIRCIIGVGTSNGNCKLYDIRSNKSIYIKEHQYGLPVIDVTFHDNNSTRHVLSTDKKVIKIWERNEPNIGRILTNIETPSDINGLHCVSDQRGQSGLIMLASEQSRMMTYFIPQLGPAPRWCSFLEGLTEELEETTSSQVCCCGMGWVLQSVTIGFITTNYRFYNYLHAKLCLVNGTYN